MDELLKLAERCEKATGNDVLELINLECDICRALGIDTGNHEAPFTSSLDSAMTLVAEGYHPNILGGDPEAWDKGRVYVELHPNANRPGKWRVQRGTGGTHSLALCAAALRARANPSLDGR